MNAQAIFRNVAELDISTMEREAFQRGDTLLASLLGQVLDLEETCTTYTTEAEEAASRANRLCENIEDACTQIDNLVCDAPDGRITKEQFSAFLDRLNEVREFLQSARDRESY